MLSRFHLIPERDGQTDGRTDKQNSYINIERQFANARYKVCSFFETPCTLLITEASSRLRPSVNF